MINSVILKEQLKAKTVEELYAVVQKILNPSKVAKEQILEIYGKQTQAQLVAIIMRFDALGLYPRE